MAVKRFYALFTDIVIWFFILFYPLKWLMDMLISSSVISLLLVHGMILLLLAVSAYRREGQTWGQKLASIEIKTVTYEVPSFLRLFIHFFIAYLLYLYSFGLLYIVSMITQLLRKDDRMLHDLISGTKLDVSYTEQVNDLQIGEEAGENEQI
ncbi:RDD family protein [Salibacterium halotolerans]|uniref:RDD family protein n=1 Tax=Salibacterium halotolerans TaxID=1884432 RepID=A0A1I5TRP3_9BACI|nr:RDD family protein [Salibacterium halotolerans]SFP85720.1 RDD family protein [Salibacterium halotolerans]